MNKDTRIEQVGGKLRLKANDTPQGKGKQAVKALQFALGDIEEQWSKKNPAQQLEALRQTVLLLGKAVLYLASK